MQVQSKNLRVYLDTCCVNRLFDIHFRLGHLKKQGLKNWKIWDLNITMLYILRVPKVVVQMFF